MIIRTGSSQGCITFEIQLLLRPTDLKDLSSHRNSIHRFKYEVPYPFVASSVEIGVNVTTSNEITFLLCYLCVFILQLSFSFQVLVLLHAEQNEPLSAGMVWLYPLSLVLP